MTDTTTAVRIAPEDIKWLDDLLLDQMDESASRSEECGPHEHDSRIIRLRSFLAAAPVAPGEGELADAVMRVDRWANYAYTFADTIAVDSPLSTFTAGDLRLILSALRARSEPEAGAFGYGWIDASGTKRALPHMPTAEQVDEGCEVTPLYAHPAPSDASATERMRAAIKGLLKVFGDPMTRRALGGHNEAQMLAVTEARAALGEA